MSFLAAVVQLTTTEDVEQSLARAEGLIDRAAERGAQLVVLPENVSFMGPEEGKRALAETLTGPTFSRLATKASRHGLHLLAGTLPEASEDPARPFNTSVLVAPCGEMAAVYRKIHLFDVELAGGESYRESAATMAGDRAVVANTDLGVIGMSICYDLRFPDFYRALCRAGATMVCVPAAFTVPTGRDHWEVLLRARAIENQLYVLAAAQYGMNTSRRSTYGRSMIIDPWGTVIAACPDGPGLALAEIDLERVNQVRAQLPCQQHERRANYRV
jgi:predicted amidohydrolase